MRRKIFSVSLIAFFFQLSVFAQDEFKSEEELKTKAAELFTSKQFIEANPLYAQLLSLYPQDPEYNFKYGACLLATESDKLKPLKYLNFAASKGADPLTFYYLGRAHHLNYNFSKAVKNYSRFKNKISTELKIKYQIDRQIEMCKNGNKLLSKINEVQVVDRKVIAAKDFYRVYELDGIDGKIVSKPDIFQTKYDKKNGESSIVFLPDNAKEVYYSSFGKKGETGRDIYKAVKLGSDSWSEPVKLGEGINTDYDEEYPYVLPDGRTMYFASKGHTSMGGYDLFKSTFDESTGKWTEPENLDFAFSSADDDIMFVTNATNEVAYFSSNRSNEAGKFTVYKVLVDKKPAELSVIKGKFIIENNPALSRAKVTVVDKATNETVGVYQTDEKGNYSIEIAENGGSYQFTLETTEDAPIHTGEVNIPKQDEFAVLGQELRLVGEGDNQQLVIKNIFDGTTASNSNTNGPQVSSELLRSKANLEVNYASSNFESIDSKNQNEDKESNKESQAQREVVASNTAGSSAGSDEKESRSNSSNTQENNSAIDKSELKTSLGNRVTATLNKAENNINKKGSAINVYYSDALKYEEEAKQFFEEGEILAKSGASTEQVVEKNQQGKLKALKAGIAIQIAQSIENSFSKDQSTLNDLKREEDQMKLLIESDELDEAVLKVKEIESRSESVIATDRIIVNEINVVTDQLKELEKEIATKSIKKQSFAEEKEEINTRIKEAETELENSEGERKIAIQNNVDQLKIDIGDIRYQEKEILQRYENSILEQKVLETKKGLLVEKKDYPLIIESSRISKLEKEELINRIKKYEDNEQVAYLSRGDNSSLNSLAVNTNDRDVLNNSSTTGFETTSNAESSNSLGNDETIESINEEFQEKLSTAQSTNDLDVKNAQELKIYDNWIEKLETNLSSKELEISSTNNEEQRVKLGSEIDKLQYEIDAKTNLRSQVEDQIIQSTSVGFADQVSSSNDGQLNQTTDDINNNDLSAPADLNEIDDQSVIDDSFTNFDFEQDVGSANAQPNQTVTFAKKALFEAKQYSEKAEEARQAAYTLPTVEERTAAFEKANKLKQQSEQKQLLAAKYYADFNREEFEINRLRLENANQYETDFESNNLDLANLLEEEASNYFNQASEIRSSISTDERLSVKEVKLQKAYDYEILAIEKQKEAMRKLNLAYDDYLNPTEKSSLESSAIIITDETVLLVTDQFIAKQRGDSLLVVSSTLRKEADSKRDEANSSAVELKKDSLLTIAKNLEETAKQNENRAAVYYQREEQIKQGNTAISAQQTVPAINRILRPVGVSNLISSTSIAIDTVKIDEEREKLILTSQAFVQYEKAQQNRDRVVKESQIEYNNAVELSNKKQQLQKQALIERNKADNTEDIDEKQRLVKSAEVIDLQIESIDRSIDSINTLIKVKNYIVSNAEQKMKASIANLSELEQKEVIQLSNDYEGEVQLSGTNAELAETNVNSFGEGEFVDNETSQGNNELERLETDVISPSDIPLVDEENGSVDGVLLEDSSRPKTNGSGKEFSTVNADNDKVVPNPLPTNQTNTRNDAIKPEKTSVGNSFNTSLVDLNKIPRELKQAIFITLNKDESAYNKNSPIPVNVNLPDGLVYKIQVGAFRNPIAQNLFKGFAPLMAEKTSTGITRYTAGLFIKETNAISARDKIRALGYPDAFVVAFLNGKRVSLNKARKESGEAIPESNKIVTSNSNTISAIPSNEDKRGLSNRFDSNEVEKVVSVTDIEKVFYTVQVGVFSKPVNTGTFNYSDLNVVELPNGLIRYNAGIFDNSLEAADLKITINAKIKDAFVTAYNKGKRISINEASSLKNK